MLIKATLTRNGVIEDIIIDPNKDWVAIQFTARDLVVLGSFKQGEIFIAGPNKDLADNKKTIFEWAKHWPKRFFGGTHRPPEGSILAPNGEVIKLDGNHR